MSDAIRHPLLSDRGADHGFGLRGWPGPAGLALPRQVHGTAVAWPDQRGRLAPEEADAVLSNAGGPPVGVVTADCLPILLASSDGRCVGAIHAGWRGLAKGVIGAALAVWQQRWGSLKGVAAVIGPHAGVCCYEVDAPVFDAFEGLEALDGEAWGAAFRPARPGRWMCDLAVPARFELRRAGIADALVGATEGTCTICGGDRFESFRRDGAAAGRMVHAVTPGRSDPRSQGPQVDGGAGTDDRA